MNAPIEAAAPYLSASRLSGYLRCAKQYYFRYIAQAVPAHQSVALSFGRAWGEAIGHHLMNSTPERLVAVDELTDLFRTELEREIAESLVPVLFDDNETAGSLTETARKMLTVFQAEVPLPDRVLGVEVAFSINPVHPRTHEELPVPIVGALDALVVENGKPVVWELKTSKRKYNSIQFDLEMLQPIVYAVGARALDIEDPEIAVIVTTKSKTPVVQIERLRRHETDEIELFDLCESVLRGIEAGVFPRNRSWQCKTCPYAMECQP